MIVTGPEICHVDTCPHGCKSGDGIGCRGIEWRLNHAEKFLNASGAALAEEASRWGFHFTFSVTAVASEPDKGEKLANPMWSTAAGPYLVLPIAPATQTLRDEARRARPPSDEEPWVVADDEGVRVTFRTEDAAWRYRNEYTNRLTNPTVARETASTPAVAGSRAIEWKSLTDERIVQIARSLAGPIQSLYAVDRSAAVKFARAIESELQTAAGVQKPDEGQR